MSRPAAVWIRTLALAGALLCACTAWARPISPPSGVTAELRAMFWDLNGATRIPRFLSIRQKPAVRTDFPTSDPVPQNIRALQY